MRVITYTLHKCVKCMRCLKTCPFEAITIKDERVLISADKCINCGACISACKHSGLSAKGSTLVDLQNYKIKIGLVPSSIYCDCSNETDARRLNAALLKLGFDELVSLSPYEGAVYEKVNDLLKEKKELYISSFCPVVNELIEIISDAFRRTCSVCHGFQKFCGVFSAIILARFSGHLTGCLVTVSMKPSTIMNLKLH